MVHFPFNHVKELELSHNCAKRKVKIWGRFFSAVISNLRLYTVWNEKNVGLYILRHKVVNTVKLTASQFSKINRPIFSDFKLYAAVKLKWLWRKIFPHEVRFGSVRWKLMLFNDVDIIEKSQVSSTNLWDKLQFVNSVKRLVFDLTKIPLLKRLISIPHLIVEVLKDQNLFTESNLANRFSSYVQFCPGCHFSERVDATW